MKSGSRIVASNASAKMVVVAIGLSLVCPLTAWWATQSTVGAQVKKADLFPDGTVHDFGKVKRG